MSGLLNATGLLGIGASQDGTDLTIPWAGLTYKGVAATAAVFDDGGETVARCFAETLDNWWNVDMVATSNYDKSVLVNYKTNASNYSVASATKLTRRYTSDIYYTIGNLASATDDGAV